MGNKQVRKPKKPTRNSVKRSYLSLQPKRGTGTAATIGRRIINIGHFFNELKQISSHGHLECGLSDMDIVSESRISLQSKFKIKCNKCKRKFIIITDDNVNMDVVKGAVAADCEPDQLNKITAAIGLPSISRYLFKKNADLVSKKWYVELEQPMPYTTYEESQIARNITYDPITSTAIKCEVDSFSGEEYCPADQSLIEQQEWREIKSESNNIKCEEEAESQNIGDIPEPELTVCKTEVLDYCEPTDMSTMMISEGEPIKCEATEWNIDDDKPILELLMQHVKPEKRKGKKKKTTKRTYHK